MRRMEDAKKMYEEIPVPEELSGRVLEAVEQAGRRPFLLRECRAYWQDPESYRIRG